MFAGVVLLDCCRNVPEFLAELGAKRSIIGGTRSVSIERNDTPPVVMPNLLVSYELTP